ncbi:DUF2264 domain-containing protein [Microbacterium sp. NPDC056052]|uniref:DUF2264 domain-containing protein n=1 Tax=Microbacterium sp. NPDC056052 TaxID=3345695 RepID=UPI0035E3B728
MSSMLRASSMAHGLDLPEWRRADWTAFADRLIRGALGHSSSSRAQILLPGRPGGFGPRVDGLEGFARTFLIAGARIAGERGDGVGSSLEHFREGVSAGVDPDNPERWIRTTEHPQAKVEAASIALMLDLTRPWLWDTLDPTTQARVIDYLSPVVGDGDYPLNNWRWFRVVVQTFLRSVGGPWSAEEIRADVAMMDDCYRGAGWYADGPGRNFDHYVGWAMHLYPTMWVRMHGAEDLAQGRAARDVARLDRFLDDALAMIGGDGAPLFQGRSLTYRFAAAAPFWAGAIAGVPSHPLGQLRTAAEQIVRYFDERGATSDDVLSIGWHGPWRPLAQTYSGPGSPYWAGKGLLGLLLPAEHPVWHDPATALPIHTGDSIRVIESAGWVVSATSADGIVRVSNHGTDHADIAESRTESPLYARLGYSTATTPLLDGTAWLDPEDQSVVLLTPGGTTHRTGMTPITPVLISPLHDIACGGATWRARTIVPNDEDTGYGQGRAGVATDHADIDVLSVLRSGWEARLVRVRNDRGRRSTLRIGGWALSGQHVRASLIGGSATAYGAEVTSTVHPAEPDLARLIVTEHRDASPLGAISRVPTALVLAHQARRWCGFAVGLGVDLSAPPAILFDRDSERVAIRWSDGVETVLDLNEWIAPVSPDRPTDRGPAGEPLTRRSSQP